jgi:hypothetical protein
MASSTRHSRTRISDITDGTSNTMLFGERQHKDANFDTIYTTFPVLGRVVVYCRQEPTERVIDRKLAMPSQILTLRGRAQHVPRRH